MSKSNKSTLEYNLLLRVEMWSYNRRQSESLTEKLFIQTYGDHMGNHYYNKWIFTCEQNFMRMIAYFRGNDIDGQKFCDMIMKQVEQYEKLKHER